MGPLSYFFQGHLINQKLINNAGITWPIALKRDKKGKVNMNKDITILGQS